MASVEALPDKLASVQEKIDSLGKKVHRQTKIAQDRNIEITPVDIILHIKNLFWLILEN